jgi:hypothetical protein
MGEIAMKPLIRSKLAPIRGGAVAAAAFATACAAALTPGAAQAGYQFLTINDPADPPFKGLTFTNLLGINNSDLIAGFYGSGQAKDPNKGFLLTLPNTFMPMNFPGSVQTQMTGLNDTGTAVGYLYTTNGGVPVDNQFGFYEKGGSFFHVDDPKTPTSTPPGILIENQLLGVTNNGLAVGFYNSVGMDAMGDHAVSHGYTYDIATKTFSADINDPSASLTNGGTVAAAINNSDEVAGFFTDGSGVMHGFIDNGGVFTTVSGPGATQTQLLGLNDKGMAVGFDVVGGVMHGILYDVATKTFTIVDPAGSAGTTLNGINDLGQIVGFFVDGSGNTDGLLANPVPEPSTWAMILAGFAGLGWLGLRRSRKSVVVPASV